MAGTDVQANLERKLELFEQLRLSPLNNDELPKPLCEDQDVIEQLILEYQRQRQRHLTGRLSDPTLGLNNGSGAHAGSIGGGGTRCGRVAQVHP